MPAEWLTSGRFKQISCAVLLLLAAPSLANQGGPDPETADAQSGLCGPELEIAADHALSKIFTLNQRKRRHGRWSALRAAWKKYASCDDGSIAEGFSGAAVRLLGEEWPAAKDLLLPDPVFRAFVLRHIDATEDAKNILIVRQHASNECGSRKGERALCEEVVQKCDAVLEELEVTPEQE